MLDYKNEGKSMNFSIMFMEFSIPLGCKGGVHHGNPVTDLGSFSGAVSRCSVPPEEEI